VGATWRFNEPKWDTCVDEPIGCRHHHATARPAATADSSDHYFELAVVNLVQTARQQSPQFVGGGPLPYAVWVELSAQLLMCERWHPGAFEHGVQHPNGFCPPVLVIAGGPDGWRSGLIQPREQFVGFSVADPAHRH
jgi:hypothetical protein